MSACRLTTPMAALRSRGIDARLARHRDHDQDALVLATPDRANLMRLEDWLRLEMT